MMPPPRFAQISEEHLAESTPLSPESSAIVEDDNMDVKAPSEESRFQGENAKLRRQVEDLVAEVDDLKVEAAAFRHQAEEHAAKAEELSAKLAFQTRFRMGKEEFDELVDLRWETNDVTLAENVAMLQDENLALKRQVAEFKRQVGMLKSDMEVISKIREQYLVEIAKEREECVAAALINLPNASANNQS
jgi:hypothetical protein